MKLTAEEILAVSKAVDAAQAKVASTNLPAGEYNVDVTVRVYGSLKRGEDYDQRIVAKADPWLLLALSLSHLNGVTVESLVRESVGNAIDPKEIKAMADKAMAEIKGPTVTHCNGKVTVDLAVNVLASSAEAREDVA